MCKLFVFVKIIYILNIFYNRSRIYKYNRILYYSIYKIF